MMRKSKDESVTVTIRGKKVTLWPRTSPKKQKISIEIDSNIAGWTCQCGDYVAYGTNHQCEHTEGDSIIVAGTTDGYICPMCFRHVPNGETCKNIDRH